jgi:nucleoside-diphosphate-sugar epimerase
MSDSKRVLVTGAPGYIGVRLLSLLTADGWRVRCLARQPENLLPRVPPGIEVEHGDLLEAPGCLRIRMIRCSPSASLETNAASINSVARVTRMFRLNRPKVAPP